MDTTTLGILDREAPCQQGPEGDEYFRGHPQNRGSVPCLEDEVGHERSWDPKGLPVGAAVDLQRCVVHHKGTSMGEGVLTVVTVQCYRFNDCNSRSEPH